MSQSAAPVHSESFNLVSDMENHLADIDNLLMAIMLMVDKSDEPESVATHCVARLAHSRCIAAEKIRSRMFKLMHPHRHQLEAEGRWPE